MLQHDEALTTIENLRGRSPPTSHPSASASQAQRSDTISHLPARCCILTNVAHVEVVGEQIQIKRLTASYLRCSAAIEIATNEPRARILCASAGRVTASHVTQTDVAFRQRFTVDPSC